MCGVWQFDSPKVLISQPAMIVYNEARDDFLKHICNSDNLINEIAKINSFMSNNQSRIVLILLD
jgi:hypothetical protein